MKRTTIGALTAAATITAASAIGISGIVTTAGAAYPGENGRIAYTMNYSDYEFADRGIATVEPDGTGFAKLTDSLGDFQPAWSPDGTRIAYTTAADTPAGGGIAVMNADGTDNHFIIDGGSDPTWSPDGTRIAYVAPPSDGGSSPDIWVANADGTDPVDITNSPESEYSPSWSVTDDWIAFGADNDIWAIHADGTGRHNITDTPEQREESPDWSPDGTRIAYDRLENPSSTDRDIWVANADGSDPTNLTDDDGYNTSAAWSPDGTRIAFGTTRTETFQIWVMNADGTGQQAVTDDPDVAARQPSWQPITRTDDTTTTAPDPGPGDTTLPGSTPSTTTLPGGTHQAPAAIPVTATPAFTG